ncbi:hypothetical protein PIB30_020823 [Stylosanthes scabra]|uniref:Uncharacterized protein n=1 Tax=Stylosanthes scabra TaxID=79078 RepID=A0ABU6U7J8_9FABA|nr:hypothetical protein [Stylosanthes scabra]
MGLKKATKHAVRATPDFDAYASSPYAYTYKTIIYLCEVLDNRLESDKVFNMRVIGIEFFFLKSSSLFQSDDNSSLSRFILASFAFLGHFQSDSNLSRPETLEQTYQGRDELKGGRRSYRDVFTGKMQNHGGIPIGNNNTMQNLDSSKFKLQIDKLKEEVKRDCRTLLEVQRLGSFRMVLIFDSKDNMEEALQSPFLLNHFFEVRRWETQEVWKMR